MAVSARRIFLWEGVVQGRSKITYSARQCERQKKAIKKENHGIAVTPTCGGFRRSKLETAAGSAKRIFLCEGFVQGVPDQRYLITKAKKGAHSPSTISPASKTQIFDAFLIVESL